METGPQCLPPASCSHQAGWAKARSPRTPPEPPGDSHPGCREVLPPPCPTTTGKDPPTSAGKALGRPEPLQGAPCLLPTFIPLSGAPNLAIRLSVVKSPVSPSALLVTKQWRRRAGPWYRNTLRPPDTWSPCFPFNFFLSACICTGCPETLSSSLMLVSSTQASVFLLRQAATAEFHGFALQQHI